MVIPESPWGGEEEDPLLSPDAILEKSVDIYLKLTFLDFGSNILLSKKNKHR
jgi:hypothetical protein